MPKSSRDIFALMKAPPLVASATRVVFTKVRSLFEFAGFPFVAPVYLGVGLLLLLLARVLLLLLYALFLGALYVGVATAV